MKLNVTNVSTLRYNIVSNFTIPVFDAIEYDIERSNICIPL